MNKKSIFNLWRSALVAAFLPLTALAADTLVPSAGLILQQVQPATPLLPSDNAAGLKIEGQASTSLPASAPFMVGAFELSGNVLFETAHLQALIASEIGKKLTLVELGAVAQRITNHYHSHDYPLARAIVPAQTIRDGVVHIDIIEARYGQIRLDNRSPVIDSLLTATLAPLQTGHPISQAEMDHALLLLSDVPGVVVLAVLKPGAAVGSSDLQINTTPGPTQSGNLVLDGYGSRYTGRERLSGSVSFINPLHHGDTVTLSGLSSGNGMNYARVAYESLLNGRGTHLGGAYSALQYGLGDPLAALQSHGSAQVASAWLKHTLVRNRNTNTYGQIQFDALKLKDHIDASAPPTRTDRHLANLTLSLTGDSRDTWLTSAVSAWNLSLTSGRVTFDDAAAQLADAASAQTAGQFSKINVNLVRLEGLSAQSTLYLAFSGQWARRNLDASQKMTAGGPYTVRAYDMGDISGDSGFVLTLEWRHELGQAWAGQWQAVVFLDSAAIKVNQSLWTSGSNDAVLRGLGLGLNWAGADQWSARIYLATPLGSIPALVGTSTKVRAWMELAKRF